ncbi:uncharacterized protein FIESC28_02984 [Fusarium coffeatum]|uniref:2EXR domain-containing protein n=1 Tax=Fusarium coffeatum TaxID=231269 RepID=A0A366S4J3_9HYPO|nr:uncharacterized protein FIESC28_02984 [Fusarium coffeatum]RBR24251.1 hypothetical protein FIESC28_02984 [Fusarium coffeatum]
MLFDFLQAGASLWNFNLHLHSAQYLCINYAKMALETFPQFTKLPKEIQIMIWEAAVRPVPGDRHVHRFFIADYHLKHPAPLRNIKAPFLNLLRVKNHAYASLNHSTGLSLAIPKDDVDGNPNDSVYLSDSSLWIVCKDSRQAMERRFNKNEWWSKEKAPFHPKRSAEPGQYLGQEGVTHTASYTSRDDDGIVKHITIDYQRDLIHMDARYLGEVDWFHLAESNFLPIFDMRAEDSSIVKLSFVGDNIAVDFDRSMYDGMEGGKTHFQQKSLQMYSSNFIDMVRLLINTAQRNVWFIDYGLVPVQNTAEKGGKGTKSDDEPPVVRETFRSSDCIYTEVKFEDIGTLWRLSDYDKAYDGENHHAHDMLEILVDEIYHSEHFELLRVLACQPAPGRPARPRKPWTKRCHSHLSCEECHPKPVPRVRPSTIEQKEPENSGDISESDLNLFD